MNYETVPRDLNVSQPESRLVDQMTFLMFLTHSKKAIGGVNYVLDFEFDLCAGNLNCFFFLI